MVVRILKSGGQMSEKDLIDKLREFCPRGSNWWKKRTIKEQFRFEGVMEYVMWTRMVVTTGPDQCFTGRPAHALYLSGLLLSLRNVW